MLKIARSLRGLCSVTGPAQADVWTAHARYLLGQRDEVPALLEQAEQSCRAVNVNGLADALRYRRGRLLGGDTGKALVDEVTQRFRAEGVRNPARLANAFVPSFFERM